MIGSGGTICRETALMGVPTITFHFWDAIAKYLHKKGFPMKYVTSTDKIINMAQKILKAPEKHRTDTRQMLEKLESPAPIAAHYIEKFL
jgi:predicted glycosyltransferase